MNQNLKKDYTLEKNYRLLSQQFGKLISFGRRSSSAERKSIRVLKNSAHRKTSSNSKRIIFPNNLRLFEKIKSYKWIGVCPPIKDYRYMV